MAALVEAVTIKDLLSIRGLLEREAEARIRYASPGLAGSCTMVCLMWSVVLTSTSSVIEGAESIARCMLVDTLALLGNARPACDGSIGAPTWQRDWTQPNRRAGQQAWR